MKMEIFEPEATGRNSVARKRKELPQIGWCQNDRNFGGFAAVHSDFYLEGPKRAFLAFFWAPGVHYCVVGFGARAVFRKTPIYFIF